MLYDGKIYLIERGELEAVTISNYSFFLLTTRCGLPVIVVVPG